MGHVTDAKLDEPIYVRKWRHFTTQRSINEIKAMSDRELRMWYFRWAREHTIAEKRANQID